MTKARKSKITSTPVNSHTVNPRSIITKDGYDKLIGELEDRKVNVRNDIANKLEHATEQGDLSENAAYKAALEEKDLNERKIEELEKTLANSDIVEDTQSTLHTGIGSVVLLKRESDNESLTYTLVGKSETDPGNGLISVESPLGKAIYGKAVDQKVQIVLPKKTEVYVIKSIK